MPLFQKRARLNGCSNLAVSVTIAGAEATGRAGADVNMAVACNAAQTFDEGRDHGRSLSILAGRPSPQYGTSC